MVVNSAKISDEHGPALKERRTRSHEPHEYYRFIFTGN